MKLIFVKFVFLTTKYELSVHVGRVQLNYKLIKSLNLRQMSIQVEVLCVRIIELDVGQGA